MKKKSTVIQWCVAGFFLLSLTVTGFHWTSLLLIIAAVLMMPLAAVQNVLTKRNIKRWMAITAAGVLFFIAIVAQPPTQAPQNAPVKGSTDITTIHTDITTTSTTTTTAKPTTVTTTTTTVKPTTIATTTTTRQEITYVLNTNTHKIHHSDCSYVKKIKPENYQEYQGLLDVLIAQDYEYCKGCF